MPRAAGRDRRIASRSDRKAIVGMMGQDTFPEASSVWSTPRDSPTYPRYPIHFRDSELLSIQYRTDPDAIRALLPAPLEPLGDVVLFHIARWGDVPGLGADLYECNIMVGASLPGANGAEAIRGAYSPWFFLDNDRAIAQGREVQGQPKRAASIALETRGDLHVGTVTMNGIDIITATLPYKPRESSFDALIANVDMRTNINLKAIPHIDGRMAVLQLVARTLADVTVEECWQGPSTVELRPNAGAPVHRLPVRGFLDGFYWRASFSLVGGKVLHDYLAADAESGT
jgi:acetoacetate decarboxylase